MRTHEDNYKNADYQRFFADSLVKTLGYQGAIQACHENLWHGVLEVLYREKRTRN